MTFCKKNAFVAGLLLALTAGSAWAQAAAGFVNLPLCFEDREAPGGAQFLARGRSAEVSISGDQVQISRRDGGTVRLQFSGASDVLQVRGTGELPGKINYLLGNDPAKWRTGVPTFSQVRVDHLYPGIDAVYYGNERQLEYDFTVSPGTKPDTIAMRFTGAGAVALNAQGDLITTAGNGEVLLRHPLIYQTIGGARQEISGGYKIENSRTVAFTVGAYDHRLPLVIDPILTYSSYLGGTGAEVGHGVAIGTNDGAIYLVGQTLAPKLATAGAFQTNFQGGGYYGDAFVAKFGQPGTNLIYLTYLGGSDEDLASCVAVNGAGNAFVGGYTDSPNFPVTTVAHRIPGVATNLSGTIFGGYFPLDGFVAELSTNGAGLVYSTFLGGNQDDGIYALAIDNQNNAYVTGFTFSTNFPVTNAVSFQLTGATNHLLNTMACTNTGFPGFNYSSFVAKIHAGGTNLDVSTFFGGNDYDIGTGIAVDGAGNVYVTGYTCSTNFPNTNAFQLLLNETNFQHFVFDGYAAKFGQPPGGTNFNLLYSTYLGGAYSDEALAIAADSQGGAYVTGFTTSTNFPNSTISTNTNGTINYPVIVTRVTNNVNGYVFSTNVFLTKITTGNATNHNQAVIAYSVVFGGSLSDAGNGVAVDAAGNAFVTGSTVSTDFPTNATFGLLRPIEMGGNDVFVTAFNPTCSQVLYSAYLGGAADDIPFAIAVDAKDNAYITGYTDSANFPATTNAPNFPTVNGRVKTLNSAYDAFLAEVSLNFTNPPLALTSVKSNLVTVSWLFNTNIAPETAGYILQTSTNLTSTNWLTVTNWLTLTNGVFSNSIYSLTLPATNPAEFFRLQP